MKKMFKAIATIAAILSMANFVACKSDDDGGSNGSGTETVNLAGTYWVVEDEEHTDGNATVKFTNESYIYIKDGSNGTLSQIEEWDFTTEKSETYNSSSYVNTAFTYTVTDSGITITSDTDTATAILSEDGNSITVTITVAGETIKSVYNKATAAPEEATLVVTVTSSSTEEETTTIDASWDFNVDALTAAGLTTTAAKPTANKTISVASGSGATLTLLSQIGKSLKIQNATSGGLNVGAGSSETEVLSIAVEGACTLTFTGKGSTGESTFATTKTNSFSVAGTSVYVRKVASETSEQSWTYSITEAGTYKIAASGMIFTALSCK